jgi:hypothetical protein
MGNVWQGDPAEKQETRKEDVRVMGFYPQLGVVSAIVLALGYWWVMSPLTEGIR